ncbi:MAG: hypothetical protein LUC92_07335 [Clostridiales bacterium]|nr:hypothetical protein [Clostridiales bacterium]
MNVYDGIIQGLNEAIAYNEGKVDVKVTSTEPKLPLLNKETTDNKLIS